MPSIPATSVPDVPLFERAVRIAAKVHRGQSDRFGKPFLLHVLRVAVRGRDADEQVLGALHDVLERSDLTVDNLRQKGFPEHLLSALEHISRLPEEAYETYIDRVARNPLAVRVKVNDLSDKLDLREVGQLSAADLKRYNRQIAAFDRLKGMAARIVADLPVRERPRKAD